MKSNQLVSELMVTAEFEHPHIFQRLCDLVKGRLISVSYIGILHLHLYSSRKLKQRSYFQNPILE